MESLIVLIPLSVVLVAGAMAAFLWAVDNGQYDQLDRDAQHALSDADAAATESADAPARRPEPEE